jgi:hypothetical protein
LREAIPGVLNRLKFSFLSSTNFNAFLFIACGEVGRERKGRGKRRGVEICSQREGYMYK